MAIYVKEQRSVIYPEAQDYLLFADASASLTGPSLTAADHGPIVCEPGSRAYCLNGELYILSTAGTWTKIVNGLKTF
jgi:hypothetical protein